MDPLNKGKIPLNKGKIPLNKGKILSGRPTSILMLFFSLIGAMFLGISDGFDTSTLSGISSVSFPWDYFFHLDHL